jgi:hypothetical protein
MPELLSKRSQGPLLRNPVLKLNTKPIQRGLPVPNRHVLYMVDIAQCHVEQFAQRIIACKRSAVLCNLAQAHFHIGVIVV